MRLLLALLAALVLAAPAAASERQPTLTELESEVICPSCQTTLDQSDSPAARQMKTFIARRIAAGDTKSEIKEQLVAEFGQRVLASPPKRGFSLLAWLLPLAGIAVGAAVLGGAAWRWSHVRGPRGEEGEAATGEPPLDDELERRLDEELLRFDA